MYGYECVDRVGERNGQIIGAEIVMRVQREVFANVVGEGGGTLGEGRE